MNDFIFEPTAWELEVQSLKFGSSFQAVHLLTLLEGEDEQTLEDVFQSLEQMHVTLDVVELPKPSLTGEIGIRLHREEMLAKTGDFLRDLEEADPLRLYLEELSHIPAFGDISILAEQMAKGDEAAKEKLLNLSLSRVFELACENAGRGVLLMDLIQEGSMGLWQSILNYVDGDFQTHRDWWISQAMAKLITLQARENGVGQKMRQSVEDYRSVDEQLLSELGRNPTQEEIAERLHMPVEEVSLVADMLENARMLSKAKAQPDPVEEKEEDQQAVEDTAYFQLRQHIAELLSSLDEKSAKLLTMRFGLEGGLPKTPEETGKLLGMTREEVIAAEAAALAKLRNER
ncbi:MAG: sigma-70 family RNA polymerase sigma factor [Oscillospiraceae bacterium]|nr:sigma-70 family RNA polymerase sigma factor [Oscillospiraceae bacterium]